jgi:hypothetical protein
MNILDLSKPENKLKAPKQVVSKNENENYFFKLTFATYNL